MEEPQYVAQEPRSAVIDFTMFLSMGYQVADVIETMSDVGLDFLLTTTESSEFLNDADSPAQV